jgi:hypothetical protein
LITLLAINLAVVLVTPVYQARQRSNGGSAAQLAGKDGQNSAGMASANQSQNEPTAAPNEEDAATAPAESTTAEDRQMPPAGPDATMPPSSAIDGQHTTDQPPVEKSPPPSDFRLELEPLLTVGERISRLDLGVDPLGHPIAEVAGQLSQWLIAHPPAEHTVESSPVEGDSSALRTASRFVTETNESQHANHDRIVLRNPRESRYRVVFLVGNDVRTLDPGTELVVDSGRAMIRFDRGGNLGETRQELEPGIYRFSVTSQGWKLQPERPTD